jgi:putative ATPase
MAMKAVIAAIENGKEPEVPPHLRNAPTKLMAQLGHGKNYRYPHDEDYGYAPGQEYLPSGVAGGWYHPTSYGQEKTIRERLMFWRELETK